MLIPAVLKDGHEELVSKDELQLLIAKNRSCFLRDLIAGLLLAGIICVG
jgi:hypothetical protein